MRAWLRPGLSIFAALAAVGVVLAPGGYLDPAFAAASTYVLNTEGSPPAPQPILPDGWDFSFVGSFQPMMAAHGPDCSPPPATHQVSNLQDMVYLCKNHFMTAIDAGWGSIYMTPDQMLDLSQGTAVLKWNMSTLRTSSRDWVDLVITPFNENMQLSFENTDVHLPTDAVHIEMGGADVFIPTVWRNGQKQTVQSDTYHTWDMILAQNGLRPDAQRRDTFELDLSQSHIKFGMPDYNFWWVDTDIAPLNWNQGVVQLNHRSYNPEKACNWDGSCGPNTWHWSNVSISPATPFTIVRADHRLVDANSSNTVTFPAPAPSNAFLRFVGLGIPIQYSLDGGATWLDPKPQGQPIGPTHPEIPDNYWTPIPGGTTRVQFRGQDHSGVHWEVTDASYWVAAPSLTDTPQPNIAEPLQQPAASEAPTIVQQAPVPKPNAPAPPTDGSSFTLSFDDLGNVNQPLGGQYPTNVIDWGQGHWWLAGPYGQWNNNSISFNGDGPTSGTFRFISPRELTQLDIDNGGSGGTTITLACDGQATVQADVSAGKIQTLQTGWTTPCTTITITSTNGWYSNFKNLQVQ